MTTASHLAAGAGRRAGQARSRLAGWAPVALLLAWFLAPIGARPLSIPDEARYAIGREMLRSGQWIVPLLDGVPFLDKPPLHYWANALSFAAFGVHPWSLRLPVALAGFAGCLLVRALGARWYGPRAGWLAALVLASSPLYYVSGQYANLDLEVAVLVSAATACLAIGMEPDRAQADRARTAWVWAGWALAGAATLAKGFMGVVVPLGAVGSWLVLTGRWRELRHLAPVAGPLVYAAVTLPWFMAVQRAAPEFFDHFVLGQHFERFLAVGRAVNYHQQTGPWMLPAVLLAGMLPWTAFLWRRAASRTNNSPAMAATSPGMAAVLPGTAATSPDRGASSPGAAASPTNVRGPHALPASPAVRGTTVLPWLWALVALALLSVPRTKFAGYALPALMPLALLVGRHWDAWLAAGALPRRAIWPTVAVLAALAVVALALPEGAVRRLEATGAGSLPAWLAAIGAAGAVLLAAATWRGHAVACLAVLAACGASVSLLVLTEARGVMERNGVRPLAQLLQARLRPGDTVASFRHYYYDLPHYLDLPEPMIVADTWTRPDWALAQDNWRRHLFIGRRQRPESSAWLIEEAELPARCPPQARCFVVTSAQYAADLQRLLGETYAPLSQWGDAVLFGPNPDG